MGADYTFDVGNGLLVQGQYIYRGQGSLFMPYIIPVIAMPPEPGEVKPAHYLYGRFGYDFNQDSSVDLVLLHGFEEKGGLIRPAYTYRFPPNAVQLELSLVKTYGKEDGVLASIPPSQAGLASVINSKQQGKGPPGFPGAFVFGAN